MKIAIFGFFLAAVVCLSGAKPAKEKLELIEDMILNQEQKEYYSELKNGRARRAAMKDDHLWPGGIVYYKFNENLTQAGRNLARDAMKHYEDKTCINFTDVNTTNPKKTNYAEFKFEGSCHAIGGYARESGQLISIGSAAKLCSLGSTIHEIGHTVGFFHEQSRPDRDEYIKVIWKNIKGKSPEKTKTLRNQFRKVSKKYIDSRGHDYDYGSIMHYSKWQGAFNGSTPTMEAKKKVDGETPEFGQRFGLSQGDIAQLKTMYKCNDEGGSDLPMDLPAPVEDEEDKNIKGPKPGQIQD